MTANTENDTTIDFAPVLDELNKVKHTTTDLISSVKKLQAAVAKERKQFAKKGKKASAKGLQVDLLSQQLYQRS